MADDSGMTRIASDGGGGTWVRRAPTEPTPDRTTREGLVKALAEALCGGDKPCVDCWTDARRAAPTVAELQAVAWDRAIVEAVEYFTGLRSEKPNNPYRGS